MSMKNEDSECVCVCVCARNGAVKQIYECIHQSNYHLQGQKQTNHHANRLGSTNLFLWPLINI